MIDKRHASLLKMFLFHLVCMRQRIIDGSDKVAGDFSGRLILLILQQVEILLVKRGRIPDIDSLSWLCLRNALA